MDEPDMPARPREIDPLQGAPGDRASEPLQPRRGPEPARTRRARTALAGVVLALFLAMLATETLTGAGLQQTSLFYVGIPAVIALAVILTARPRNAVGVALATTTVGLALAGPLLDEGVVCLVVAAPLFYGIAALVGLVVQRVRGRRALVLAPLLLVTALEGVAGTSIVPRVDAGSATEVVDVAPARWEAALAAPPEYGEFDAALLDALPFPEPVAATGHGLAVGAERHVVFTPRRSLGLGADPTPRSMVLRVSESEVSDDGGRVVFDVVEDSTLARWMELRGAEVEWDGVGEQTRVTWRLDYRRTFDPSWYFGPVQRYATDRAAAYLLETFVASARAEALSGA